MASIANKTAELRKALDEKLFYTRQEAVTQDTHTLYVSAFGYEWTAAVFVTDDSFQIYGEGNCESFTHETIDNTVATVESLFSRMLA